MFDGLRKELEAGAKARVALVSSKINMMPFGPCWSGPLRWSAFGLVFAFCSIAQSLLMPRAPSTTHTLPRVPTSTR